MSLIGVIDVFNHTRSDRNSTFGVGIVARYLPIASQQQEGHIHQSLVQEQCRNRDQWLPR